MLKHSLERKKRISESLKRAYREGARGSWNKGKFGYKTKPHTEEAKKKMSVANHNSLFSVNKRFLGLTL